MMKYKCDETDEVKNLICAECMLGAPYIFCCRKTCREHEFCKGCTYPDFFGKKEEQ